MTIPVLSVLLITLEESSNLNESEKKVNRMQLIHMTDSKISVNLSFYNCLTGFIPGLLFFAENVAFWLFQGDPGDAQESFFGS
jgi:hypothetical protein